MLRATSSFKLSKSSKRSLATILDPHLRGEIRRSMVQAELHAQLQPRRERRSSQDNQTD